MHKTIYIYNLILRNRNDDILQLTNQPLKYITNINIKHHWDDSVYLLQVAKTPNINV